MKITVQNYRLEVKQNPGKPRKGMDGQNWSMERIKMDCIWVNLKNVGPPFFKFMSVYIKTSFTQRPHVPLFCSCHILTSSQCDLLLNRRTPKWNLFVLYNNETNYYTKLAFVYFKTPQHNMKAGLCPAFAHFGKDEKKPFGVMYYL